MFGFKKSKKTFGSGLFSSGKERRRHFAIKSNYEKLGRSAPTVKTSKKK